MWLKLKKNIGVCPACGEDLEHNFDDRGEGKHYDVYTCRNCGLGVTYISPDDERGEYHNYNDFEIEIQLDADECIIRRQA